ncbi:MAG: HAD family hydrolase, partial [Flavobacterium sp.]
IVATKGDLKDQHRKLHDSGIGHYFHHIEVMIDKTETDYHKMLQRLEIDPEHFIMIGNSLKSDVLPVLDMGGIGIHIPYHTTWAYERIDFEIEHPKFWSLNRIDELIPWIQKHI